MTLTELQKTISTILRRATGLSVITEDKIEGIDSKRPCFIVSVEQSAQTVAMKYWNDNIADVTITYFGSGSVDLQSMADTLNSIFGLTIRVGDRVLLCEDKTTASNSLNVLTYSFSVNYRTSITNDYNDITVGHIPHISDYADDTMGDVTIKEG